MFFQDVTTKLKQWRKSISAQPWGNIFNLLWIHSWTVTCYVSRIKIASADLGTEKKQERVINNVRGWTIENLKGFSRVAFAILFNVSHSEIKLELKWNSIKKVSTMLSAPKHTNSFNPFNVEEFFPQLHCQPNFRNIFYESLFTVGEISIFVP